MNPTTSPFDKRRFLPLAAATTVVAVMMACVLGYTRHRGQVVLIAAAYGMLPVLGMVYLTIVFGRCRNAFAAGTFAVLMASIYFWGQFPAALGFDVGFDVALWPGNVVRYIRWRWAHEAFVPLNAPADWVSRYPQPSEPDVHWMIDVLQFFLVTAAIASLAAWRAGWLFCEKCQRWSSRVRVSIPWKSGGKILEMYESGKLGELNLSSLGPTANAAAWMIVEYCKPLSPQIERCPVNLSIIDGGTWRPNKPAPSEAGKPKRYVAATKSGQVLDREPLSDTQVLALSNTISQLKSLVPVASLGGTGCCATGAAQPEEVCPPVRSLTQPTDSALDQEHNRG